MTTKVPKIGKPWDGWTVPPGFEVMTDVGLKSCIDCGDRVLWQRKINGKTRGRPMNRDGTSHRATCTDSPWWRKRHGVPDD